MEEQTRTGPFSHGRHTVFVFFSFFLGTLGWKHHFCLCLGALSSTAFKACWKPEGPLNDWQSIKVEFGALAKPVQSSLIQYNSIALLATISLKDKTFTWRTGLIPFVAGGKITLTWFWTENSGGLVVLIKNKGWKEIIFFFKNCRCKRLRVAPWCSGRCFQVTGDLHITQFLTQWSRLQDPFWPWSEISGHQQKVDGCRTILKTKENCSWCSRWGSRDCSPDSRLWDVQD